MRHRNLTDMTSALGRNDRRGTAQAHWHPRLCPIALAVLGVIAGTAQAQQADSAAPAGPAAQGEVVIVTGQRASLRKALAAQEKYDNIVSVVSADDIGQMPDKNAAEALARMPGVAVQRDQGEGRYIVVRGLSPEYNTVSINGALVPSPDAARRQVALDVLPAGLIRSLEVSKTLMPEHDANSLGGSANVKTLSAFDLPGTSMSLTAGVSRDEKTGQTSPNAGVLWADRFADGKIGVAIGASMEKRKFGSDNAETGGSWTNGRVGTIELRDYMPERERAALALNLDYRPEGGVSYFMRSFASQFSDDEQRDRLTLSNFSGGSAAPDTPTSARVERRLRSRKFTQDVRSLVLGTEQNRGDWKFMGALGAGSADDDTPESVNDARFRGAANFAGVSFSGTELPLVSGPAAMIDPANFKLNSIQLQQRLSTDKEHHLTWSATRSIDWGEAETDLKFGSKWSRRHKTNDTNQWLFNSSSPASPNYWGPGSDLMSGFTRGPLDYSFANLGPGISDSAIRSRIAGLSRTAAFRAEDSALNDYVIDEDIDAAFVQASTKAGAWTVLAGIRNERTDMKAVGNQVTTGVGITPVTRARSYSNWLPAFQLRYDADQRTSLRGAFSSAVVRPNFSQFAPGIALASATEATIGNPDLKAVEAKNIDIGIERMIGSEGAISAYLFTKDISNFTYTTNLAGSGAWANYTSAVSYANGDKASVKGIELSYQQGLRMLPAPWNDLVLNANFSQINSEADIARFDKASNAMKSRTIRFPGQARQIYNLSVGYEGAAFSAKVSLNSKSNYLLELGSDILDASGDRYVDAQRQVDLSMGYKFSKRYQLVFEAANLNDEHYYVYQGNQAYNAQYEQYGRTYKISLKVNLY